MSLKDLKNAEVVVPIASLFNSYLGLYKKEQHSEGRILLILSYIMEASLPGVASMIIHIKLSWGTRYMSIKWWVHSYLSQSKRISETVYIHLGWLKVYIFSLPKNYNFAISSWYSLNEARPTIFWAEQHTRMMNAY